MPVTIDKDEVLAQAIELGRNNGYIDIVALANKYGIKVFNQELDNNRSGFIQYDPDTDSFSIYSNSNETMRRQRFSIAHELAHRVLHQDKIIAQGIVDRENEQSLSPSEENEADQLAANILMPEFVVKAYVEEARLDGSKSLGKNEVQKIADKFNVSMPMATIRMRQLEYYVPFLSL